MNNRYPSIDLEFIMSLIDSSDKVEGTIRMGSITAYVLKGSKPIAERMIVIKQDSGQVPYMFASATAIKLKCVPQFMEWLEANRNWKDGGYTVKQESNS